MTTAIKNAEGETIDFVSGLGEDCDMCAPDTLKACKNKATMEVNHVTPKWTWKLYLCKRCYDAQQPN